MIVRVVLFSLVGILSLTSMALAHDVDRVFHNQTNSFVGFVTGEADPCGYPRQSLADKHAPAGLMGDHVHHQGEFMVEYKYMIMFMEDNRVGTNTVSDRDALTIGQQLGTNFGATPTQMTMEMHMVHMMYGLTDDITLYVMPMLLSNTMDHIRGPRNPLPQGTPFTTHISGFGDTILGGLVRIYEGENDSLILNLGGSLPTGELDRVTTVPTGGRVEQEFPYPMRLGSGTFNARPGLTYKRYLPHSSFGLQFQSDLPIGRNWDNYSVGNSYQFNGWYSQLITPWLATSFRVEGLILENFDGADPDVNGRVISTVRPDMRGGEFINFGYGAAILADDGYLLNMEAVQNIYQDLDGIQLERDWTFWVSWSKAW